MLHSVSCPQPKAEVFVKMWNNKDFTRACVHAFIDANTGIVYQPLPWNYRAPHCGGSANNTHIGVEMCEPASIKYSSGSSFTCTDKEAAVMVIKRAYEAAVELFASLCKQYGLNPLEDGVIISHKEGHDRRLASGHGDPDHLWKGLECEYTMDAFRQAIAAALGSSLDLQQDVAMQKQTAGNGEIETLVAGDVVSIKVDAVYYNGTAIPGWIVNERWGVKSVHGDRAVIDKSVSGKLSICSPFHVSSLTVVR